MKHEFDHGGYRAVAVNVMTAEIAKWVRDLRVEQELTWRQVATTLSDRFPEFDMASNQLAGSAFCDVAAESLGENYFDENWN